MKTPECLCIDQDFKRSYPLFSSVVIGVRDAVLVVWFHGNAVIWRMFCTHMVVSASLGTIGFSTVLTKKQGLLIVR